MTQEIDEAAAAARVDAERKQWADAKIARYELLRARLLDGRSEDAFLQDAERVGPYLTLMRGLEPLTRW